MGTPEVMNPKTIKEQLLHFSKFAKVARWRNG